MRCSSVLALTLVSGLLVACAPSGPVSPHPNLTAVWRSYQTLDAERAMAIAGDPRGERWVIGAVGGRPSREEAEAEALIACRRRRAARRMQAACLLYAVGNDIVWSGP